MVLFHVLSSRIFYPILRMPQNVAHAEFAKFIWRQLHGIEDDHLIQLFSYFIKATWVGSKCHGTYAVNQPGSKWYTENGSTYTLNQWCS